MTKKGKNKGNPEPPIVLRDVLAKPELIVHSEDLTVTARALAKLLAEKCDYLFVHDGKPVIVEVGEDDIPPSMRRAGVNEIIIAAHKYCQPRQKIEGRWREVTLPDKVAGLYSAMPDEWRLRPLACFASSPLLHDDGSITLRNGYDAASGVYIYNVPQITLPDTPSRDDAERALATLRHPFRTFAFADRIEINETFSAGGNKFTVKVVDLEQPPGRDESAFLTALLTAVCRPSLPIAPGVAVRSPSLSGSGVGKKLLLNAISHVAFGRTAASAALGNGQEFEKGLVAGVIRPDPMFVIDNFNGRKLQSDTLCTVLTDRPAILRILGVSELKEANPLMFIGTTGNAFTFAEDLVRRNFVIELDAKVENPELRRFAGDFLADIAQQRSQLLQAALIIWRYGRQQVRSNRPPLGGFETWSRWCRDPLVALRCRDPVAEIAKSKTTDPNRRQTVEIFQTWWEQHADGWVTINDLDLYVKLLLVPDPKKRNRQSVEHRVRKLVGTRLAGFHLTSDADDENKGYWSATKYRLEQVGEDESEPATAAAEAAAGSQGDDPDDFYFNREGDDAAAQPAAAAAPQDAKDSSPSEQAKTAAKTNGGQRAPGPAQQPLPSDPVERWRVGFARLDPRRDPCAGFRTGEWPRIYNVIRTFLAGPFAKHAVDHGWTDRELFGVHPVVGVARPDCCGVLMANALGAPVTRVTSMLFQFGNLVGHKATLNVGSNVPVWDWKGAAP